MVKTSSSKSCPALFFRFYANTHRPTNNNDKYDNRRGSNYFFSIVLFNSFSLAASSLVLSSSLSFYSRLTFLYPLFLILSSISSYFVYHRTFHHLLFFCGTSVQGNICKEPAYCKKFPTLVLYFFHHLNIPPSLPISHTACNGCLRVRRNDL